MKRYEYCFFVGDEQVTDKAIDGLVRYGQKDWKRINTVVEKNRAIAYILGRKTKD